MDDEEMLNAEILDLYEENQTAITQSNITAHSRSVSQMVTYLICDLRKEFFKRVQARFR